MNPPFRIGQRLSSHWLDAKFLRYFLATIGPVGSAIAQFALSVVLLRALAPEAFGAFSFLLVASQFCGGITGALFCAPLPVLMSAPDDGSRDGLLRGLFAANFVAAAAFAVVFLAAGVALGLHFGAAALFATFAAISSLRWFARAHAYALASPLRSTASDMAYSATLLMGTAVVWLSPDHALELASAAMALSAAAGLAPFGATYLREQFVRVRPRHIARYGAVWREHSGWSFLGVLTTEATANAHVYIVTFALGAGAFAPLAASALLIRPISVITNALTEFERAQLARQIAEGRPANARRSLRVFLLTLVASWVATAAAAALLLIYAPRLLFPERYELGVLSIGAALWIVVAGVRVARTPHGVLLQAAGKFRLLAFASVVSSIGSVLAVTALLALHGPLGSIGGIVFGEILMAVWIWRAAGRWSADNLEPDRRVTAKEDAKW